MTGGVCKISAEHGCLASYCLSTPSFGKTIVMYDANSTGAINYLNLAREILEKNNLSTKD